MSIVSSAKIGDFLLQNFHDYVRNRYNYYVEKMNFKGLQKPTAKTETNDRGKFKKKKRFGKSLANKAPAMLLTIINRKLSYPNNLNINIRKDINTKRRDKKKVLINMTGEKKKR